MRAAAWLGRCLSGHGAKTTAAARLGTTQAYMSDLLNGKRWLSSDFAARLILAGWPRAEVEAAYLEDCRERLAVAVRERESQAAARGVAAAAVAVALLVLAAPARAGGPAILAGQIAVPIATANPEMTNAPATTNAPQQNDATKTNALAIGLSQAPSTPAECVYEVRLLWGAVQFTSSSARQCAARLAAVAMTSGEVDAIEAGVRVLARFEAEAWPPSGTGEEAFRR